MKLRYTFITTDLGNGEFAAVPVGDSNAHGMLKLNDVSADILEQLKTDTTPQQIHLRLKERFPTCSDREIGEKLAAFLNKLISEGLLIAP